MSKKRRGAKPESRTKTDAERIEDGRRAAASLSLAGVDDLIRTFDGELLPLARELEVIGAEEGAAELCAWRESPDAPLDSPDRDWSERALYHLSAVAYMLADAAKPALERSVFLPGLAGEHPRPVLTNLMMFVRGYLMGARDRVSAATVAANKRNKENGGVKRKEICEVATAYARAGKTKSFATRCIWASRKFDPTTSGRIANILSEEFPGDEWRAMKPAEHGIGPAKK